MPGCGFELHNKVARWTCPLWEDVPVTGLVIYPLLYHIFLQKQMPARHHSGAGRRELDPIEPA